MQTFVGDPEFVGLIADKLLSEESEEFAQHLSTVLHVLHSGAAQQFHNKASKIFDNKNLGHVRAASAALRVYSDEATVDDVAQIKKFLSYPDSFVKRTALQAIAYMGKNVQFRHELLDAALSVNVDRDAHVATRLAEAFGTYGVPFSLLTEPSVSRLLKQFLHVEDFDADQGKLTRFLSQLATMFPDQVTDLLIDRVSVEYEARKQQNWSYRTFDLVHGNVSFELVKASDRRRLSSKCLEAYLAGNDDSDSYAKLFWIIGGAHDEVLDLLVAVCDDSDSRKAEQLAALIKRSPRQLVFAHPGFARALLGKLSGSNRQDVTKAFVSNAHSFGSGGFSVGPVDHMKQHLEGIKTQIDLFPKDGDLAGLADALTRSIAS
jgi:hypothetical protein